MAQSHLHLLVVGDCLSFVVIFHLIVCVVCILLVDSTCKRAHSLHYL